MNCFTFTYLIRKVSYVLLFSQPKQLILEFLTLSRTFRNKDEIYQSPGIYSLYTVFILSVNFKYKHF